MRAEYLQRDFYQLIYDKINEKYPNKVHNEYLDEVKPLKRTYPWITIKTGVDYANTGLKKVNNRTGRIKIVCYSKDFEESLTIASALNTAVEELGELYLENVKSDGDKVKLDNKTPYWQSLDFETKLYINNQAP